MSDTPCVNGCGQDAATIERLREQLARLTQVLHEWGALSTAGDVVSAEDFAEAIEENGAWRLARDLRAALAPQNHPRSAVDAPEVPGQPGRGERGSGGSTAALARVLRSVGVEIGYAGADTYRTVVAERILADPGPLLAALAEAGVLQERVKRRVSWLDAETCHGGDECPDPTYGPHTHARLSPRIPHTRYVTEWRPDARP